MGLIFTAEEVRQHIYCPRIVYFRKVQHLYPGQTYKMERGSDLHEEEIRKKKVDEKARFVYYYNLYLVDEGLRILALLDCLETDGERGVPIDLKTGRCYSNEIKEHHLAQLIVQAILVEMQLELEVKEVRVNYMDEKKVLSKPISMSEKLWVLNEVEKMRKMVESEVIPRPTRHEAKCVDCEYWAYCQGV
ncbi:MAG: CRISPR-associated protein Cas4 [Candidatus Helarchaeota archaeon]